VLPVRRMIALAFLCWGPSLLKLHCGTNDAKKNSYYGYRTTYMSGELHYLPRF
jgi:hypothetical protein